MTDRTKLHQNERLDIVDAKSIQDLVYEYLERMVGALFGRAQGVAGTPPTANFTLNGTDIWADDGAGTTQMSLSGRSFFVRSSDQEADFSSVSSGTFTKAGARTGHLIEFNAAEAGQTTTVDFAPAIAAVGGIAVWKQPNIGTSYGLYARRTEVAADNQGRIFWSSAGGGTEITSAVNTRTRERVEFTIDKSAPVTSATKSENGWVLVAKFRSVDSVSGQPEITWMYATRLNPSGAGLSTSVSEFIDDFASQRVVSADPSVTNADVFSLGVPSSDAGGQEYTRSNYENDGSLLHAVNLLTETVNKLYHGGSSARRLTGYGKSVTPYDNRRTGESLQDLWTVMSMYGYHGKLPVPAAINSTSPVNVTGDMCWQPLTLFSGFVNITTISGSGIAGAFEAGGTTSDVMEEGLKWVLGQPTNANNVDAGSYPAGGTGAFDDDHGLYQRNFSCPGFNLSIEGTDNSKFSYINADDPALALNLDTNSLLSGRGLNPSLRLTWGGDFVITAIHCSPVPFLFYSNGQAVHQGQVNFDNMDDDDSTLMYARNSSVQAYMLQGLNSPVSQKPYIWVGCYEGHTAKKKDIHACPFYITIEGIRYNNENPTQPVTSFKGNSMIEALKQWLND